MRLSPLVILISSAVSAPRVLADVSLPSAVYSADAVLNPSTPGSDFWLYEETSPGNLLRTDNPGQLQNILSGHAAAPGGNLELFPLSETAAFLDASAGAAFATTAPVTLSGTAGLTAFSFRSLNGNDWFGSPSGFNNAYGAQTLATQWFNGFLNSVADRISDPLARAGIIGLSDFLFNNWRDSGGFAALSDANIGYIYENAATDELNFGLEGFLDASPRFREFLDDSGLADFSASVPDGIQYSEVVILDGEAKYSFNNASPSGVQLDDAPYNSYTGNFGFVSPGNNVPEPTLINLASLVGVVFLLRRRRAG